MCSRAASSRRLSCVGGGEAAAAAEGVRKCWWRGRRRGWGRDTGGGGEGMSKRGIRGIEKVEEEQTQTKEFNRESRNKEQVSNRNLGGNRKVKEKWRGEWAMENKRK